MISIITAIHNGLPVNQIFLENLKKYTYYPFELIIIDNCSKDESANYFMENGAIVIKNDNNYSYPYSQNQGIKVAKYNYLAFLNNDIVVAPNWDRHLIEVMSEKKLDVICPTGIERLETRTQTKRIRFRWKMIKESLMLLGKTKNNLLRMHKWMYGNWESYANNRWEKYGTKTIEGFIGNTVVMTRNGLELLGLWDERIQAADFDVYVRSKKRNLEEKDVLPCQIALGVFHHHYIRLTMNDTPTKFADAENLISLEEKWGKEALNVYLADNVTT